MEIKNICPICLRANRKLKVISTTLSEYHNELTNHSLLLKNPSYCSECECLLRKTYNFHHKCANAAMILNKWMNTSTQDQAPVNLLHLKLPPTNLDKWTPDNNKAHIYTYTDCLEPPTPGDRVSIKLDTDTLTEINKTDKLNVKDIKDENTESKIDCEKTFKVEFEPEQDQYREGSDVLIQNFNKASEDTDEIIQNKLMHKTSDNNVTNPKIPVRNSSKHSKVKRSLKTKATNKANTKISIGKVKSQRKARKPYVQVEIGGIANCLNNMKKPKLNYDDISKLADDIPKLHEVALKLTNDSNDSVMNDTEDMELDVICIKDKDNTCDKIIIIDDENRKEDHKIGLCLKERLKTKLKNWGKLKTDDGFVFNKDIIIKGVDMLSDQLIERLLSLMHGKKHLDTGTSAILKEILEKTQSSQYESVFDIEYLTTEKDKLEEFERRKTYECYVKAKSKCEICYQAFKGGLEYHKKSHDERQGQFLCYICHIRHFSKRKHQNHMSSHSVVYKCKLCPLVTYYKGSMINHYEQHKGTIYKCEKCSKIYKSKSMLKSHQGRVHARGDHVCAVCGGAYLSKHGLNTHMVKKHRGESPAPAEGSGFSCQECALSFPSEEACARHRKRSHGVRQYMKRKYSALTKPRRKPIMTCPECKAVGHSYGWMTKHFDIEHPALDVAEAYADKKAFLCDVCGKGFTTKFSLQEHIGSRHSGVKFPCPSCAKQFSTQEKLKQHRIRHGPPEYCCDHCQKKFHTFSNLCNHKRTHIGDRCFKCHICGKGFLHKATLREHIRGVHYHERRARKRGVSHTRGVSDPSHRVSDTRAIEITVVGAETIIGS